MGNLVSNISRLVNAKEEKDLGSSCVDYTYSDVPVLIPDSNIELSLSDENSEPLESLKTGENDSVIHPLNDQSAKTTIVTMPKIRARPRPKPKPRSVQIKERELMLTNESLSQYTLNKVTEIIKPLPNHPSFLQNFDSSTDDDSDYEADENEAQNVEEAKIVITDPSEVSIPRTQKLDKNGQPIYEKCNCFHHQNRNVFID